MENRSDKELVRLSLDGNASAFEHLVQRHYQMVYRVSYKWCGVKEDAEDIAQDVFVKLAKNIGRFGGKASFRTWLYRVTLNTAKDFLRKASVKQTHEAAWAFDEGSHNPGTKVDARQQAMALFAEIDRLPEKQKSAVLLVFGEGLSHKEAADVLSCRETTVSWRIFQARKKLRRSGKFKS